MSQKLTFVKNVIAALRTSKGFDKIYDKLDVLNAAEGKCSLAWKVDENLLNQKGTMHGGVIASVIDNATTIALQTSKRNVRGVSLELSVSYIGAAKPGDTLQIDAFCRKIGSTIAFTEATVTNQDGKLLATGKHTKFILNTE
eukprot:gene4822-5454_t